MKSSGLPQSSCALRRVGKRRTQMRSLRLLLPITIWISFSQIDGCRIARLYLQHECERKMFVDIHLQETSLINPALQWLTLSAGAVLNRLGEMHCFDAGVIHQIRDGARQLENAVVGAGRELHLAHRGPNQRLTFFI